MWKQNNFIWLTAKHSLEKVSDAPPTEEDWLDEKQLGEEMSV